MKNRRKLHGQGSANGVDVNALRETLAAIRDIPSAARLRLSASTAWLGGGRSRSRIDGFYGAGRLRRHAREFVLEADFPSLALGTDRGASPDEYLLVALASCLTASLAHRAALCGVSLDAVRAEVSGEIDLRGVLGLAETSRPGFREIRVLLRIASDASDARLDELVRDAGEKSSVLDLLTRSVPVRVEAERSPKEPRKEIEDE